MKIIQVLYKDDYLGVKVDDKNYEKYANIKFSVSQTRPGKFYFRFRNNGKYVYLHRDIISCPNTMQADHIDGDTLNNTVANLRQVDYRKNAYNRRQPSNSSRKYKGVVKYSAGWGAEVVKDGKSYTVRHFDTEKDAAIAYNELAAMLFGEYLRPNIID